MDGCSYASLCDDAPPDAPPAADPGASLAVRAIDEGAPRRRNSPGSYRGMFSPGLVRQLRQTAQAGEVFAAVDQVPRSPASPSVWPVLILLGALVAFA